MQLLHLIEEHQCLLCFLCKLQEVCSVSPSRCLRFPEGLQALQSILTNRLQHGEAWSSPVCCSTRSSRLLSAREATVSRTDSASPLSEVQSASMASRVQPPTKTESRRKSCCSWASSNW